MYTFEDVKYINVSVPVRYEEDDMPNDYPFRKNDIWDVTIDVSNGQILDWISGTEKLDLYMKVVDTGVYALLTEDKNIISTIKNDYVPDSHTIPGKYGDYIDFQIDENGIITNWYENPTFYEFESEEEDDEDYDD